MFGIDDAIMIPSLVTSAGSLLGGLFGLGAQKSANDTNIELAKYAYDRNVDMWHMQNAYNLPSAQMERLRAAGLNPNLVYGNGSVTGNTVGSAPQMETPHVNPTTNGGFVSDAVSHAMVTPHQLANLDSQTSVNEANAAMKIAERLGQETENKHKALDYHRASQLYQNSLDMANETLREMKNRADVREKESALKQLEIELMPLRKNLTEAQYENFKANSARLIWDLDQEKAGRIPQSGSVLNWFINQCIRAKNGDPSVFTSKNGMKPEDIFEFINPMTGIKELLK